MSAIVLTGGGTAGHCAPNLALIPYLKNDFDKIFYIGSETGIERNLIESENLPYYPVSTVKFRRGFSLSNLKIPFILKKGIADAGKLLDKIKPDVVFSKGGYVALPVVFAARKRKIPVISHESDYSMGLANRLTARFSEVIITAFPETARKVKRGIYCGNPLRKSLFGADKISSLYFYGLSGEKPVLLVTGGSTGSKYLNNTLRSALPDLLSKFEVLHVCGKGNLDNKLKIKGYVQTEFTEMEKAYA
ncbi:MAG: UDP-N-acetylglucosamine--N-acetylmuramyl-(pentapeptide) pyrophosphoryl-undecaprenol N-acetylglucosamine transferase, partial [Clostridia bacterium]|nr:UDP-N-acetylglucosamine--N-acetylmuramyl-(pentapeptide) pyrophosphoryl-undecaprenol N-acetylglucosamine transferase [Clostridia bacterium]